MLERMLFPAVIVGVLLTGGRLLTRRKVTMKAGYVVALAMLGGMGIWAVSVHSLHAQTKPPVYAPPAQASIKAHGGVQLAGGPGTVIEGSPPGSRIVIVRRDSTEQLKGWRYSPEYTATHKIDEKYAKFTVMTVNGGVR